MKTVFQWMLGSLLGILPLNLQALNYIIQDLGTLSTDESCATRINNQNWIVGFTKQAGKVTDFIWKPDQELVSLPHPTSQVPLINNHNQMTGIFWHETNYWFANNFRSKHLYIYHNDGLIQDLGAPKHWKIQELSLWQTPSTWDDKELGLLAFNDHQQILLSNASDPKKATQYAIWENGTFKDIDSQAISSAYGMNHQGVILGRKWVQQEGVNVPMLVLYHSTEGTIVEIMKDVNIIHRQLNDLGQVIAFQVKESVAKGFLWDPKKGLIDLEDFAPLVFNNCDQIIGLQISEFQNQKTVPLIWTPDGVVSLAQLIGLNNPESLWGKIVSIDGINDNGYIIGQGLFDGKNHAFVLIPQ